MHVETERAPDVVVEHAIDEPRALRPRATSWGAIWAGFFVGVSVELILTILMAGIFGSTFLSSGGSGSGGSFGIGIACWIFVESIVAFGFGGWVAGKLARFDDATTNGLHGAAVWGLMTAALLYLGVDVVTRGGLGAAVVGVPGGGAPMQAAGWVMIYAFIVFLASLIAAYSGGHSAKA